MVCRCKVEVYTAGYTNETENKPLQTSGGLYVTKDLRYFLHNTVMEVLYPGRQYQINGVIIHI
jgi:hypothetical protein